MILFRRIVFIVPALLLSLAHNATSQTAPTAGFQPAPQQFRQEVATKFTGTNAPAGSVQLLDCARDGSIRVFSAGHWWDFRDAQWRLDEALTPPDNAHFTFANLSGAPIRVALPWRDVRQLLRAGSTTYVATPHVCLAVPENGATYSLDWTDAAELRQIAVSPQGVLFAGSSAGLWTHRDTNWQLVSVRDDLGRAWAVGDAPAVGFDSHGQLWFGSEAGAACQTPNGWRFFEGKDGLPWNDFSSFAPGPNGEVWFATHLGVERWDGSAWAYREGPRWLPADDVTQIAVGASGNAWFAAASGVGLIERRPMTLAEKANLYESDIEKFVKRTPYGYLASVPLTRPGDKSSATPQDDDNNGLWTAMYGAGECFAYAATKDPQAKARAKAAFDALRFLQKVTQGGSNSPPKGYVARSIRPANGPDPNIGLFEGDQREREHGDKLWKVYQPRWPKSADGQWFWKSDTSSDELDGHYFFYPLYFEMCADTDAERDRVREVVRDLTDDLLTHDFNLIDFDGTPTRWGVYSPRSLNLDPNWWPERGLKSLSLLSYLADAAYITGDPKYEEASRQLIDREGYAQNAMTAKIQRGPGTGNQSDNEMAFMSYYNLLRYSRDDGLKRMIRASFYLYWLNVSPEVNPFFNFAYAAQNNGVTATSPWSTFSLNPWPGWHDDAMATLYGFPLDWINWPLRNGHRLDVVPLSRLRAGDPESPDDHPARGNLVNGKVLPVENRYFDHWNTDPWQLDYGGSGDVLGPGTVFLLPYYMGLYHNFIQKP